MQAIHHSVEQKYQSTDNNCSQTALSSLLTYYGADLSTEDIEKELPVHVNDDGTPFGSINQQLATWCIGRGFQVQMYTFDCQVIDLAWRESSKDGLLDLLQASLNTRIVPALGAKWTKMYTQSYIDFLTAGGELHIQSYVSSALLNKLLQDAPVFTAVCFNTLYGGDWTLSNASDSGAEIHAIVVNGITEVGQFEIVDSKQKPGIHTVDPERLICAITAAQIECDNLLFQLKK